MQRHLVAEFPLERLIERPMLKHRPIQNHYDFELEAGNAKHCLGVKIVDIAMIKSKKRTYFQEKGALPDCTCAHARCMCAPCVIHHWLILMELNRCTYFHVVG